ncbi:hypothetical protein EVAR_101360_1 [Eumeta japonica]|uniref:Uncharacterized protein n=1 Tax=Eumeta variegata TaxID=151549 RepID=A0A4C1TBN9_EUMVA|nr:hypothetical protein EVAR_101360_1 [Eumeta japonica]
MKIRNISESASGDLQLSKDSGNSSSVTCRESAESSNSNNSDLNQSSELSFNGKIKSLNPTQELIANCLGKLENNQRFSNILETSLNVSQQFSESFILKKYSNEKSPDLFGDDEEEEEKDAPEHEASYDNENEEKSSQDDKKYTLFLKTIPDHVNNNTINESQSAIPTTCNLADNSFNYPLSPVLQMTIRLWIVV